MFFLVLEQQIQNYRNVIFADGTRNFHALSEVKADAEEEEIEEFKKPPLAVPYQEQSFVRVALGFIAKAPRISGGLTRWFWGCDKLLSGFLRHLSGAFPKLQLLDHIG